MKELSIEEKAKAYDEAIDKVAHFIKKHIGLGCMIHPNSSEAKELFNIFPELQESEDERIRKELITHCRNTRCVTEEGAERIAKWIAWLEKQGQVKEYTFKSIPRLLDMIEPSDRAKSYCKKLIDSLQTERYFIDAKIVGECLKRMNGEKVSMAVMDIEQKPADKVEPKFKPGYWVATNYGKVNQVVSVDKDGNGYTLDDGVYFSGSWCDMYHLWTIADAKDGDVLFHSDSASNGIFIFKKLLKCGFSEKVICYCDYDSEDGFCLGEHHTCCWADAKILHPATKEQRDLLFTKMKDAGYEWDAEKKELKKIEQKSAWSEGDEIKIESIIAFLKSPSLCAMDGNKDIIDANIKYLKSFKHQNRWKPSEEQMDALQYVYRNCKPRPSDKLGWDSLKTLELMYQDLKKLKRE